MSAEESKAAATSCFAPILAKYKEIMPPANLKNNLKPAFFFCKNEGGPDALLNTAATFFWINLLVCVVQAILWIIVAPFYVVGTIINAIVLGTCWVLWAIWVVQLNLF